jgi:2-polyprenyl-6-methoxyphenol hydroxylase-like FAD-dependent oxidoreductase
MTGTLSIAICGCGPAGLAAACFLADAGHRPVLIERFAAPKPIGAGLLLQPAGLAALRRIGTGEAALALGSRISRFHGATAPRGRAIFDLSYATLGSDLHALAIHRAALFSVLWAGVQQRAIPVETGAEIVDLDRRSDGRFSPNAPGRSFPAFDLVVDATGAGSRLRRFGAARAPRPYAYSAVWTTLANRGFAPETLAQRYVDARHMIGVLPVGRVPDRADDLITFFWSLKPADHAAFKSGGLNACRDAVTRLWPETATLTGQIEDIEQLTLARYSQFTMARPFSGRLAFIGDAAHSTSPQLGAGVTMAFLDAAALADALDATRDLGDALALYAATRRRHVRFYQMMSRLLTPAFQSDTRTLARLRDWVMPAAGRLRWVDRRMMELFAGLAIGPFAAATPERLAFARRR